MPAAPPPQRLIVSRISGYAGWAATNAPTGSAKDDYDGDGVSNGVEYVLGGTKSTNDSGKLPKVSTSGANLLFTFTRDQKSIDGTTVVTIEVDTDIIQETGVGGRRRFESAKGPVFANIVLAAFKPSLCLRRHFVNLTKYSQMFFLFFFCVVAISA